MIFLTNARSLGLQALWLALPLEAWLPESYEACLERKKERKKKNDGRIEGETERSTTECYDHANTLMDSPQKHQTNGLASGTSGYYSN